MPNMPAVTRPQWVASLIAGVPIVSNLLAAFGVYHVTVLQQDALTQTMTWGSVFAAILVGGDAALRAARAKHIGSIQVAAEVGEPPLADSFEEFDSPHDPLDGDATEDEPMGADDEPVSLDVERAQADKPERKPRKRGA